jgi:hypothetical protein
MAKRFKKSSRKSKKKTVSKSHRYFFPIITIAILFLLSAVIGFVLMK